MSVLHKMGRESVDKDFFKNLISCSILRTCRLSIWVIPYGGHVALVIANRGGWFGSSANIKGANKYVNIKVGKSTPVLNLLFCAHTLCMNYVINTFLLVSSSVWSKQLLCLCTVKAQKENKNLQQRNLSGFITIPVY